MPKIAIYHDYLNQYGGGERVLEVLKELFPEATVHTLFYDRKILPQYQDWGIKVSLAQYFPLISKRHQVYFWLFPFLIKQFRFDVYDLVISCTHAWGNGIQKKNAKLLVYCHTPIRYFWDLYEVYLENKWIPFFARWIMPLAKQFVRNWDRRESKKVDQFIANSREVKNRIQNSFERKSVVLYPPVNTTFFQEPVSIPKGDYFLVVCRLKPYKRVDLIVRAFNQLKKSLVVVGDGEEELYLKRLAGPTIQFIKNVSDEKLRELYAGASAYVYMAHEDFGMTLVEAQAAGLPVIAYHRGGAREIVIPSETGILFEAQSVDALRQAVEAYESKEWHVASIRKNATRFSKEKFQERIKKEVASLLG